MTTTTEAPPFAPFTLERILSERYAPHFAGENAPYIHAVDRFKSPACGYQRTVIVRECTDPIDCPACLSVIEAWTRRLNAGVAKYRDNIESGRAITLIAASERSQIGYRPMMRPDDYAKALAVLADLAKNGPQAAELVANAAGRVNLYGTTHDMVASVAESFARTMREPFDDVAARTGPEPVRHSAAQKPWSLHTKVRAVAALCRLSALTRASVPGYPLGLTETARELGVRLAPLGSYQ